ncbi:MAG TPA: alpha/beta fold hydrolase [Solirubrobacteraceae bacterium]|nr:alpha/beta fold hydrolase [Solirubrobacteraceae bacterium]
MSANTRLLGAVSLACAVLALIAPAGAGAQPAMLAFGACSKRQVIYPASGLQCATLDVPFDRADPAVGDIALAVQRVPASAPRTGVIVLLAGGPGQPALPAFERVIAPLARHAALHGFELVAFDQRGTGQSQALQCPPLGESPSGSLLSLERRVSAFIDECGAALGPTRAYYASQESVEDLNALREALGGTPLSLFAVSYGTRVAGMYAREHPQGVARMVLDSLVPTTGPNALGLERLHALHRVLDEGICGAGACREFTSDVYADLVRVVRELHRRPLHPKIYDGRGRLRPATVTERDLLRMLVGLDLAPLTRVLAPAAIAAAAHGDDAPLARLAGTLEREPIGGILPLAASSPEGEASPLPSLRPGSLVSEASAESHPSLAEISTSGVLDVATSCIEDELPWSPASAPTERAAILHRWLASLPAGTTAPFSPTTALAASELPLCMDWPATPPAPPSPTGVSATPTLILSGDDDLRTPYEQVLANLAGYSDAQLLRVPDDGHSTVTTDTTGCAEHAMIEFLAAGHAPASCPPSSEAQALPLPPASLAQVAPAASPSRLSGRVAAAAAMTVEDMLGQKGIGGGGLRGGYWELSAISLELSAAGFALHGMVDVPGVALSGTIRIREGAEVLPEITGHLFVRGRLAGRLTLHGRTLTGLIGGARVHARLAAL